MFYNKIEAVYCSSELNAALHTEKMRLILKGRTVLFDHPRRETAAQEAQTWDTAGEKTSYVG